MPTTVMAAVDASIGIKTAVNFEMNGVVKKNKLGTYSPPLAVFIDKAFLSTLDRRHLSNGAAEVSSLASPGPIRHARSITMNLGGGSTLGMQQVLACLCHA